MPTIINVSNRLPVTVGRTIKKSSGGLAKAMEGLGDEVGLKWIGWPGATAASGERRRKLAHQLQTEYGCTPVFLSKGDVAGYYEGFSNSSLWPVLHYMSHYLRYDKGWWESYESVNRRFAEKVLEVLEDDDVVWVHDYQLMLLPRMLRAARPNLRIGFFLHTPFPSYELFRCLPHREDLLQGLLGADQIGFHTFGYLRHFRSTVLRLLGLDSEMDYILHENRRTYIGVYPIGINADNFKNTLGSDVFRDRRRALRKTYRGKKIVLGVERLDYSKGISRRLRAIDCFLDSYEDKNNIVFIFISVPSREAVGDYQALREQIEGQVGQINGKHATTENVPINFIFNSVPFPELCALYSLADVALVTPVMDGMNLVAKEFVACQQTEPGALVLSEFAGAAEELFNAVLVNPYNINETAEWLENALVMPREERRRRMAQMRSRVMKFDVKYWAQTFVRDLHELSPHGDVILETADQCGDIVNRVRSANRIACFLNYDGTLREFERHPHGAVPTPFIVDIIKRLNRLPQLDLFIISGRTREDLEAWFSDLKVPVIAEHGYVFLNPETGAWQPLHEQVNLSWKDAVLEVFRRQEGTTPGSAVEEKYASLVWHYRRSDPEFGRFKAHQLLSILHDMLTNLPVELHHGNKMVEVGSIQVNKEAAVNEFLAEKEYDLVICAGDDMSDECMLRVNRPDRLCIKIGPGETQARHRVATPAEFRRLLLNLLEVLEKDSA